MGIEILRSLEALPGFEVHGAGTDVSAGWDAGFRGYSGLPGFDDPNFATELRKLVNHESLDFVYPSNDLAIGRLAGVQLGQARVVSHPPETVRIAGSKIATHRLLGNDRLVPARFAKQPPDSLYPLFSKPDIGHSSIGASVVDDAAMLRSLTESSEDYWGSYLLTEKLVSDEVTVDCFSTRAQGLLYVAPRTRDVTINGVSVVTTDFDDLHGELDRIARTVNARVELNGPWFFQAKRSKNGDFRVMEIGARLAGASRVRRAQGVNLAQLAVLAATDVDVQIYRTRFRLVSISNCGIQSLTCDENFASLYVDLDDTLILNGSVNTQILELVKHVRASGGRTAVITRHRGDPHATLRGFGLEQFFDEVHHILGGAPKPSFIDQRLNSVLIDDSFSERLACINKQNILAVDASCASLLKGLFLGIGH